MNKMLDGIKTLSDDPSKADEIEFLESVASHAPANSYLAHLFSKEMVAAVSERIKNDFSCDLYTEYKEYRDDYKNAATELANARAEVARLVKAQEQSNREGQQTIEKILADLDSERGDTAKLRSALFEAGRQFEQAEEDHAAEVAKLKEAIADLYLQLQAKGAK